MDLASFDPRDTTSRPRREGLAAAQAFHDAYGHLDVPADYTDPTGYTLGRFITTMRDAHTAGRLVTAWSAELDALNMIWDKHDAAWRAQLTTVADYHHTHGHLAIPPPPPPEPSSPSNAPSPPATSSTPPAPPTSQPSTPTGDCHTAPTGTANTTCCAPTSPPDTTRPPCAPTPSSAPSRSAAGWGASSPAGPPSTPASSTSSAGSDSPPTPTPHPAPPHPAHLRADRPAPRTLPPPRAPRPHRPRGDRRRRRTRQDRALARQGPHQTPHRPTPPGARHLGGIAVRRRLDRRGRPARGPSQSVRLPGATDHESSRH
ncbi:helicase associated domain-containing protein [Streptomyces sp. WAC00263]|uniref:helicase associated domain-containing protein n=1 Tax=Streptomyces sp. WAC00263 TaxID=1917422 RepID=UPI0024109C24|nr:Helicase associated domain protein [Streptomyces sp. WAC00263]